MMPPSLRCVEFQYRSPKAAACTRAKRANDGVKEEASNPMLYQLYQPYADATDVLRSAAGSMSAMLGRLPMGLPNALPVRSLRAAYDLFSDTKITHARPAFDIHHVIVAGEKVDVTEVAADTTPFCTLVRFEKATATPLPKVLLVAPLSGHFSTLLRNTVRTLSADHDVYLTDWHNAREVPAVDGRFGFDEYVEHLIRFIEFLGEGVHVVSVCQPCVPALAAVAVQAESRGAVQPRSISLLAGPIDTRINPTKVNELATTRPIEWFENNVVTRVPFKFPGRGRRVYPGFMQLTAFMSMNIDRHLRSHIELYGQMVRGDLARAQFTRDFYDEYFAVLDMPAEFYLETVQRVFQEYHLARGVLEYKGRRVEPRAIRRTALATVEGERDDICSVGQTMAAHDLCSRLPPSRRMHYLQSGVGHYGVFSGSRWEKEISPRLRHFILANN
jgi:poly(3-hydroxybutyrate) depolymerase